VTLTVKIVGNTAEAEKLRGFALSQLRILIDSMKFQGLKQYTRVVRFSDNSYIRAFSSFGINTVTIFAPPVSIPSREIVEVEEAVYIAPESVRIGFEVAAPQITTDCTWQWVAKSTADMHETGCSFCHNSTPPPVYDVEYIVGNQRWVFDNGYGLWSCTYNCETGSSWVNCDPGWVEPPCGSPFGCKQEACSQTEPAPCSGYWMPDHCIYYEWECA